MLAIPGRGDHGPRLSSLGAPLQVMHNTVRRLELEPLNFAEEKRSRRRQAWTERWEGDRQAKRFREFQTSRVNAAIERLRKAECRPNLAQPESQGNWFLAKFWR